MRNRFDIRDTQVHRAGIRRPGTSVAAFLAAVSAAGVLAAATAAEAGTGHSAARPAGHQAGLVPGDLLVAVSQYANDPDIVAGQTQLPPGSSAPVTAIANGNYPYVFNNVTVDPSFGVTSKIYLQELTPAGHPAAVLDVPSSDLVTSFSSKSEGALNLSANGKDVTFMGYVDAPGAIDASNSNTPGVIDPTNPVPGADYRAVGQLTRNGKFTFTETNAYSGNNGRAAVEANVNGKDYIYTAGNAGNGSNPQPDGIILGAGAQIITPSSLPEASQQPGTPTPAGSFSVTQLGDKADKVGKDDNFRGLTLFDDYPFGIWFANPDTLYVADEGSGDNAYAGGSYTAAAASATAGLQKWVFDKAAGQWNLACTLRNGLNLGTPYTVRGYPTGTSSVTGLPWAPATDGVRNITGRVNPNGTVSIWAVTSTVSGGGDQGADPNKLVEITDPLAATAPAPREAFTTVVPARYGQVVRGVSFTPGTRGPGPRKYAD